MTAINLCPPHTGLHVCKHVHTPHRYTKESGRGGKGAGLAFHPVLLCKDYLGFKMD